MHKQSANNDGALFEQRANRKEIFGDIEDERLQQNLKFTGDLAGIQLHHIFTWLTVLGEEKGESDEAALSTIFGKKSQTLDERIQHLRYELIQTAAVAVAIVERIDAADATLLEPEGLSRPR